MKTKAKRQDIREKDDAAIAAALAGARESLRQARFGRVTALKDGGVAALKKTVARLETERTVRLKTKTA